MLTDYKNKVLIPVNYENKVLTPDAKKTDVCPSCKRNDWKEVIHDRTQKYLVCKNCGHVKRVSE
ncbi:MAG: hypothetical protein MUP27_09390 [Desulfobacterales bacterium]|nr:hypothetical protein [Desulfobacterales bacterium]